MDSDVDYSQLDWKSTGDASSIDFSKLQWDKPGVDFSKLKWGAPHQPATHQQVPEAMHWSQPSGQRPAKWLFGVGPNDVMLDYNQIWKQFGKGGIRPAFRDYVSHIGDAGFAMGVYDFNRGHHYAPNDPHLDGRAVDVDSINGEVVGTSLTPKIGSFIETALALHKDAWVGVPKEIYKQLPGPLQARAFVDAPAHIHVELSPEGVDPAHYGTGAHRPVMTAQQLQHVNYAGAQLPITKQMMHEWARSNAQAQARWHTITTMISRVPITEFLDVLGAPQRAVGMTAFGLEHGHDLRQLVGDAWKGLTDAETTRHATDAVRAATAFSHGLIPGGVSRAEITQWVNQTDIPRQLKPYLNAALNTTADVSAQTLSDPFTYVGGLGIWAKAMEYSIKGLGASARLLAGIDELARVAKAGHDVGPLTELFKQVPGVMLTTSAAVRKMAGGAAHQLHGFFGVRPDLEDFGAKFSPRVSGEARQVGGFTKQGAQRRIGIENSNLSAFNTQHAADEAATRVENAGEALTARYLEMMRTHGAQADSDLASSMLGRGRVASTGWLAGIKPLRGVEGVARDMRSIGRSDAAYSTQDALDALLAGRRRIRMYATAQQTAAMVREHPDSLRPGSSPETEEDFRGISMDPMRADRREGFYARIRELQRANVMIFPFAHGIVNVGQLAYLGAPEREGLRVVVDGFRYMLGSASKGRIPGSLTRDGEDVLAKYGAAATYVHEHEAPGLWRNWPEALGGPLVKSHIMRMQRWLSGMENGWRNALWDALERAPETRGLDPMARGAMVSERAGDPRNVSAFVRAFEQMGGPFVAYRLGIVPKAVLRAIIANPQRVLATIRPVLDLQDNRTRQAQGLNTFMFNDPVNNAARLMSWPGVLNYMMSPSTIGLAALALEFKQGETMDKPMEERVLDVLAQLNPFEQPMNVLNWLHTQEEAAPFNPMPGQRMSLTDHLMGAIMAPFASFCFAKAANQKYLTQAEKRMQKAVQQYDEQFIDYLLWKGH
jgi:hypothetical protein